MAGLIDLTGKVFGLLTVVQREPNDQRGNAYWLCRCECGETAIVRGASLRNGHTKSCGCLFDSKQTSPQSNFYRHGFAASGQVPPEYFTWTGIKQRCFNPKTKGYINYGARGISVCQRWAESFGAFLADMGPKPGPDYSIERIDNDGHYEPSNCKWAKKKEQARNRRTNRMIEFQGKTQCLIEWAEELGINKNTLRIRLNAGWSVERALSTPSKNKSCSGK
jgi:hypothetical protein